MSPGGVTRGWRAALGPSAWMLGGAVVSRAAMLAAMIAVARHVSPSGFGALNLMQTAITFLAGVGGLGLGVAVTRQAARALATDPARAGGYISGTILVTAAGAAALALIMIVLGGPIAQLVLGDDGLAALVRVSAPAILFATLNASIQAALLGLEALRPLALAQWAQGVFSAVGLIAGAAADDARGALLGLSIGQGLAAVTAVLLLRNAMAAHGLAITTRPNRADLRALWRFGAPTFAGSMAIFGAILVAQVLLRHEPGGAAKVAAFNVAYRWHLAILFVPAAVAPLLVPVVSRLAASDREDVSVLFRRSVVGVIAVSALPALVVCLLASPILGLSGDFYARDTTPLIILGLATIPSALNTVISSTGISLGVIRPWLISDLVLAVVLIGAGAALVSSDGASGLAIAYLAAYAATNLVLAPPVLRALRRS